MMSCVTFKRLTSHESRVYADGEHVGDVYRQDDILVPGQVFYIVQLFEDPRGPRRVRERHRIREVAEDLLGSHPLWP